MTRFASVLAAVVVSAILATGCSIDDSPDERRGPAASADTTAPERSPSSTTTAGPADRPASAAFVEIGGAAFDLEAECHAAGVGEVVITALATGGDGPRVELYLQAFLAEPYVAVAVTEPASEPVVYEPSLATPFEIVQQGDVYRVDDVEFVTDLDLTTGVGTEAGPGTIVVECGSYATGLPPGFGSG